MSEHFYIDGIYELQGRCFLRSLEGETGGEWEGRYRVAEARSDQQIALIQTSMATYSVDAGRWSLLLAWALGIGRPSARLTARR